uniref:Uncharacterized protein n=1 Tax=Aspergillus sp. TaxID=5065 RepID=A0A4Y6A4F9_9EURO|nr:hypothetical protein [Aspergillus sp.]
MYLLEEISFWYMEKPLLFYLIFLKIWKWKTKFIQIRILAYLTCKKKYIEQNVGSLPLLLKYKVLFHMLLLILFPKLSPKFLLRAVSSGCTTVVSYNQNNTIIPYDPNPWNSTAIIPYDHNPSTSPTLERIESNSSTSSTLERIESNSSTSPTEELIEPSISPNQEITQPIINPFLPKVRVVHVVRPSSISSDDSFCSVDSTDKFKLPNSDKDTEIIETWADRLIHNFNIVFNPIKKWSWGRFHDYWPVFELPKPVAKQIAAERIEGVVYEKTDRAKTILADLHNSYFDAHRTYVEWTFNHSVMTTWCRQNLANITVRTKWDGDRIRKELKANPNEYALPDDIVLKIEKKDYVALIQTINPGTPPRFLRRSWTYNNLQSNMEKMYDAQENFGNAVDRGWALTERLEKALETPSILNAIDPEVVELMRENIEINRMPQGVYDEVWTFMNGMYTLMDMPNLEYIN